MLPLNHCQHFTNILTPDIHYSPEKYNNLVCKAVL